MPTENCDHIWKDIDMPIEIHDQIFHNKNWRQCFKCDRIEHRPEIVLDILNSTDSLTVDYVLKELRDHEEKMNLRNKELGTIRYYEYELYLENILQPEIDKEIENLLTALRRVLTAVRFLQEESKKCMHYADLIIDQKHEIKFIELSRNIDSFLKLNDDYARRVATPQEKELFQKVNELYKQVQKEWEDLKALLKAKKREIES